MTVTTEARHAPPSDGDTLDERGQRIAAAALLGTTVAVFLWSQLGRMTGPVGLSHEGQNLGVFAMGSRAIRENGLVSSYLGSHLAAHGMVYAHHPPLIFWTTAVSESLFGVHPWTARVPTIIAACAVIPLLYSVIRRVGVAPLAAAAGVVLAVGNPVFFTYSWMVDTPMLTLPFALGTLLAWDHAQRTGRRGWLVALTVLTVGTGWQGLVLVGTLALAGGWLARRDGRSIRPAIVVAVAAALTFGALMAWVWWSYGGLGPLFEQFQSRTGSGSPVGLARGLWNQLGFFTNVWQLPLLVAGPFGIYLAIRDRRTRRLAVLLTFTVMAYSLVFWEAAAIHDYWNYWAVAPFALGLAAIVERVVGDLAGRAVRPGLIVAGVGVVAMAVPVATWVGGSSAQTVLDQGVVMAEAVADPRPPDQHVFATAGIGEPVTWISYIGRDPVVELGRTSLARMAREHPTWRVLTGCENHPDPGTIECGRINDPHARRRGELVSASAASVERALEDS
jgi:4-amino-4-deoxy-L-arabinose transferase-like glycosyltransferase